ncbi:amidohydrolase family protein [Halovenus rubra]|uniref:Amidohydrolase family protein n=2 Tax=Halovenus rubra TaxID=869890 RepID=A0ABD5XF01_9EURY|nr:amidohydrolase family protein [Halovenus rubra]
MVERVIDCGRLVDGTESNPLRDARLLVADGRVADVGTQESVRKPDNAKHTSVPDATVIPGLIDAHLHLTGGRSMDPFDWITTPVSQEAARATADLRKLVSAGFTTVRDVGSDTGIGLREAVNEGAIPGPRIYTSGQFISQTGGHGDDHFLPHQWVREENNRGISTLADGEDECRKEARKRIRDGADLIKIMTTGGVLSEKDAPDQTQFTETEIQAFVEEAHRVDIPVASHAQGSEGIRLALDNGVDTIEHGFWLTEEVIDAFLETGATYVPTLSIMHRLCEYGDEYGVPEYGLKKAHNAREAHFDSVKRAYEADVPIALGTDFIGPELVPHGENALEAELFVEEVGMDEHDVVRAGTAIAARTLPDDDLGTLEPGNHADFLILDENPLDDINALRSAIRTVYKGGEPVLG